MKSSLYTRFSIMMFLEFAIWGSWAAVLPFYLEASPADGGLGFTTTQIGTLLGLATAIGALTAPFIAGQFADRYFRTERFLAVLLILGGAIKWYTAYQTDYNTWFYLTIAFGILYAPTIALTNSLAFYHLKDAERQFPFIRVWGTIGFIAAMWLFPIFYMLTDLHWYKFPPFYEGTQVANATHQMGKCLEFAGIISIAFGLYCLTLPKTPPKRDAVEKLAFAKAFSLCWRKPSVGVMLLFTLPLATLHWMYWLQAGMFLEWLGISKANIGPAMSVGQGAEIVFMVVLGLVLKRMGFRAVITIGCLAYGLRFLAFQYFDYLPIELVVASQALHGICAAGLFAACFIYLDKVAEPDVRHSTQTIFGLMLLGVSVILSGIAYPRFVEYATVNGQLDYVKFWQILAHIGIAGTIVFALLFRDQSRDQSQQTPEPAANPEPAD